MGNRLEKLSKEEGIALFYLAALLSTMLVFSGLALDLGRGYVVKAHLSKAVDGAALAAARVIGDGQSVAQTEANKIFNANFPNGYLGVSAIQNPPALQFGVASDGSNTVTVSSTAVLPTTFMKIAGFSQLTVTSSGQATKRLLDMAFVIDKSGSLNSVWPQVQSAATQFVNYFDANQDRVALVMYSSNTVVFDPINTGRGFNKSSLTSHIAGASSGGFTAMSEGLYRGWDELRRVPINNQSGLRIVVLFTDGFPNSWAGDFTVVGSTSPRQGTAHTLDFPELGGTSALEDGVNDPNIHALTVTMGTPANPANQTVWGGSLKQSTRSTNYDLQWTSGSPRISGLPTQSFHPNPSSAGILNQFNLVDNSLVGGNRPVWTTPTVRNVNNAARNLVEIIANAIRSEVPYPPATSSPPYPMRIFTLGLGALLTLPGGTINERGDTILKRIANDPSSPDFKSNQPEGKYFFAGDPSQLNAAFEQIRNQIMRLSQ